MNMATIEYCFRGQFLSMECPAEFSKVIAESLKAVGCQAIRIYPHSSMEA
jgi:hypothetical protein